VSVKLVLRAPCPCSLLTVKLVTKLEPGAWKDLLIKRLANFSLQAYADTALPLREIKTKGENNG
jgi:hypothetical protein